MVRFGLASLATRANTWPRFGLEAAEQVLRLPKVLNDAKNAAMFIVRHVPLDMPAALKVGGALNIVGGALGLVDDVVKYKSHEISGGMAWAKGSIHSAEILSAVLMIIPGAQPFGVALGAGVAVTETAIWVIENRQKIAQAAKAAGKTTSLPRTPPRRRYRAAGTRWPVP